MSREGKKQQRRGYIPGLLLLIIAVGALSTAGWLLVGRWQETVARSAFLADSNPELGPAQELMLQRYLVDNSVALQEPAGSGIESVSFTVTPGETAASITDNLIQADLLTR